MATSIIFDKQNIRRSRDIEIEEVKKLAARRILRIRKQRNNEIEQIRKKASESIKNMPSIKEYERFSKNEAASKSNQRRKPILKKRKSRSTIL